jgi:hypothetical protein
MCIALLGLLPLAAAAYFLLHGLIEAVGMRTETFRLALYLFILSVAGTELRIYVGGRSPRDSFLLIHVLSAILLTILLIVVGFFYDAVWFGSFVLLMFLAVFVSGIPLWYRGMRAAYLIAAPRTEERGSV